MTIIKVYFATIAYKILAQKYPHDKLAKGMFTCFLDMYIQIFRFHDCIHLKSHHGGNGHNLQRSQGYRGWLLYYCMLLKATQGQIGEERTQMLYQTAQTLPLYIDVIHVYSIYIEYMEMSQISISQVYKTAHKYQDELQRRMDYKRDNKLYKQTFVNQRASVKICFPVLV